MHIPCDFDISNSNIFHVPNSIIDSYSKIEANSAIDKIQTFLYDNNSVSTLINKSTNVQNTTIDINAHGSIFSAAKDTEIVMKDDYLALSPKPLIGGVVISKKTEDLFTTKSVRDIPNLYVHTQADILSTSSDKIITNALTRSVAIDVNSAIAINNIQVNKVEDNLKVLRMINAYPSDYTVDITTLNNFSNAVDSIAASSDLNLNISMYDMNHFISNLPSSTGNSENIPVPSHSFVDYDKAVRDFKHHVKMIDIKNGLDKMLVHFQEAYLLADALSTYSFKQELYSRFKNFIPELVFQGSLTVAIGLILYTVYYLTRDNEIMCNFVKALKNTDE